MRRIGAVGLAMVLVVVAVAGPAAVGAQPALPTDTGASPVTGPPARVGSVQDGATDSNGSGNASLGAGVSSFMQASAADADADVEAGMFEARFERATDTGREKLVQRRVGELERDLADVREERRELLNASEVTVRERARAARLAVRIRGLEDAINRTEDTAERAGVDTTRLDELRRDARTMTGRNASGIATGLVDIDDRRRGGPPGGAGQSENRPDRAGDARGNATESRPDESR